MNEEGDQTTGTPPHLPIKFLKEHDTVIEPKQKRLTLRSKGVYTELVEFDSAHQTTSLMNFAADGWKPTKIGLEYFRYNKHEFRIEYPVRSARPMGNKRKPGRPDRWQFVQEDEADFYQQADRDITVGQLKFNMVTATDRRRKSTLVKLR